MTPQASGTQCRILFVDDEPRVLDGIRQVLQPEAGRWQTLFAQSADEALSLSAHTPPDMVVADVTMPVRDGLDMLREFKRRPELAHIPVIMLTGYGDANLKRRALELGAFDLLTKPIHSADLKARIDNVLRIKQYEDTLRRHAEDLESRVADRTRELEHSRIEILMRLAVAGEYRDSDTGRHVVRVARVSRLLAETLGMAADHCDRIFIASALHDIGKIGVPDSILRKAGPLTPDERAEMQKHCEIGESILRGSGAMGEAVRSQLPAGERHNELLDLAAQIALRHHEKWDATGYPHKLGQLAIPIEARIVAAADVFDAMCSERPYKRAMPPHEVRTIMGGDAGRHFDPQVWAAMDARWNDVLAILHDLRDVPAPAKSAAA